MPGGNWSRTSRSNPIVEVIKTESRGTGNPNAKVSGKREILSTSRHHKTIWKHYYLKSFSLLLSHLLFYLVFYVTLHTVHQKAACLLSAKKINYTYIKVLFNSAWIEEHNIKPYQEHKEQLIKSSKTIAFKEAVAQIEEYIEHPEVSSEHLAMWSLPRVETSSYTRSMIKSCKTIAFKEAVAQIEEYIEHPEVSSGPGHLAMWSLPKVCGNIQQYQEYDKALQDYHIQGGSGSNRVRSYIIQDMYLPFWVG